jgi:hypothetical protein
MRNKNHTRDERNKQEIIFWFEIYLYSSKTFKIKSGPYDATRLSVVLPCLIFLFSVVSQLKFRTQIEDVWEHGVEQNTRT